MEHKTTRHPILRLHTMNAVRKMLKRIEKIPNFRITHILLRENDRSVSISDADVLELCQRYDVENDFSDYYEEIQVTGIYKESPIIIHIQLPSYILSVTANTRSKTLLKELRMQLTRKKR